MSVIKRSILAAALAAAPWVAHAAPVTYNFTVTATSGSLNGQSSTGYFTYDSSIIPVGGGALTGPGLVTDLSVVWNGTAYDETTANTGVLQFLADGTLSVAAFGTNCTASTCNTNGGPNRWFVILRATGPSNGFAYSDSTGATGGGGNSMTLQQATVPEPASTALAGLALAALAATRARRGAAA